MPPPPSSSITTTILPPPGPWALSLPPAVLSALTDPNTHPPPHNPTPFLSALLVRIPVFVTEQKCPLDAEIDADDARSWHWVAFDGERPVATLRLVPIAIATTKGEGEVVEKEKERIDSCDGDAEEDKEKRVTEPYHGATKMWDGREPYIKIGRMATLKAYRGQGVAKRLIEESLAWAKTHAAELSSQGMEEGGDNRPLWKGLVLSHAQKSVQGWWGRMGFEVDVGLGVWWEEGIEHVGMWRRVEAVS